MKASYSLLIVCFWFLPIHSQYTSVPDPIFEQELINQNIDSDGMVNQQVLTSDVNNLTTLIIDIDLIQDFTGLEAFVNLENLQLGGYGLYDTLNLNSLTNLKQIFVGASFVTNVDFSQNVIIETIEIGNDYISSINIDNCLLLNKLIIACPQMSTINLTNNSSLKEFGCYGNHITNFDTSQNVNLEKLTIRGYPTINIDVTNNINLKYLFITEAIIPSINLQNNTLLDYLLLYNTSLTSINLSNNTLLKYVNVNFNQLSTLDVSNLTLLEFLACQYNTIPSLNVNNNPNLSVLNCANNNMQSLFVQNGNNQLLNGYTIIDTFTIPRFYANNNPNLTCIFVDDIANATQNWEIKDPNSTYVLSELECNNLHNEQFISNSFNVYPNPVNDIVFIENNNNDVIQKIIVYDLTGKVVMEQYAENTQLNLSNIKNGFYTIALVCNGQIIDAKTLIKN